MRTPVKVVVVAFAVLAAVYLLFTVVFPWVDRTFVADPVLDAGGRLPVLDAGGRLPALIRRV